MKAQNALCIERGPSLGAVAWGDAGHTSQSRDLSTSWAHGFTSKVARTRARHALQSCWGSSSGARGALVARSHWPAMRGRWALTASSLPQQHTTQRHHPHGGHMRERPHRLGSCSGRCLPLGWRGGHTDCAHTRQGRMHTPARGVAPSHANRHATLRRRGRSRDARQRVNAFFAELPRSVQLAFLEGQATGDGSLQAQVI